MSIHSLCGSVFYLLLKCLENISFHVFTIVSESVSWSPLASQIQKHCFIASNCNYTIKIGLYLSWSNCEVCLECYNVIREKKTSSNDFLLKSVCDIMSYSFYKVFFYY